MQWPMMVEQGEVQPHGDKGLRRSTKICCPSGIHFRRLYSCHEASADWILDTSTLAGDTFKARLSHSQSKQILNLNRSLTHKSYLQLPINQPTNNYIKMSSDKSYVDQAKEAVGAAQQKASEALGSAKDTVMGTVSLHLNIFLQQYCNGVSLRHCFTCLPSRVLCRARFQLEQSPASLCMPLLCFVILYHIEG